MIRLYRAIALLSIGVSLAVVLVALRFDEDGYQFVALLPLGYIAAVALILAVTWVTGPSLFLIIFLPTTFLRYSAFPGLMVLIGGYEGRSPQAPEPSSYHAAILLMVYELALVISLVVFLERRYRRRAGYGDAPYRTLPSHYVIVVAASAALSYLAVPQARLLVNVFVPTAVEDDLIGLGAIAYFTAILVVAVKGLVFVGAVARLKQVGSHRGLAWLAAVAAAAFNVGIYFGTNRLAVVLTGVASIWLLHHVFGGKSWVPIAALTALTLPLLMTVTNERNYVQISSDPVVNLADSFQAYTGGIYNVAVGYEVPSSIPEAGRPAGLAVDLLRPLLGINLIVQGWDTPYSNIHFNDRFWQSTDRRSQIMPMIAQGNLYFSPLLAPLLSVASVALGYWMLSLVRRVTYLEVRYGLVIVVLRFGFFWGQNTMNLLNFASLYLILPLALVGGYHFMRATTAKRHIVPSSEGVERGSRTGVVGS